MDAKDTQKKSAMMKAMAFSSAVALAASLTVSSTISFAAENQGLSKMEEKTAHVAKAPKPNIVYITLDDSGFSDLASYGSEIKTPNIDKLAANGIRYNNFNVTPLCSPTRASLLTGRNNHAVGMGTVTNFDLGPDYPNKRGQITPAAGTVAEILKENNYSTFAVGKWHLAPTHQITPAGPFHNWPLGKGFERYYGFIEDSTDQFRPELVYDNHSIETPKREDYHVSEDVVDHARQFVTDQISVAPDKPFFLYMNFGAQHMPHQVPQKYIDMYKGKYDKGWDKIREERFSRQKQLGIIPKDAELTPNNPGVQPWDSLTAAEKRAFARFQETYAGFLTHTDEQIGRFIDYLESVGELENTMIVLISDNGASSIGKNTGSINHMLAYNFMPENLNDILPRLDEIGSDKAGSDYPAGWAQVSNTPFKLYKNSAYAGGTRTPLIISWPARIKDKGSIRTQYAHVSDITPTVLDVAGITAPETLKGVQQMPLHGTSLAYTFDDGKAPSQKKTQYFEVTGHRAIYHDGWRAIAFHKKGDPYEKDKWELYHVEKDYAEVHDLAAQYPDKLKELQDLWWEEAKQYNVLPITDIFIEGFKSIPEDSSRARDTFVYYPGMSHLSDSASPPIMDRSYTISIPIERSKTSEQGVLIALGSHESGYTLYIKDNKLFYDYNAGTAIYRVESNVEVPRGKAVVRYEFKRTAPNKGVGTLYINDKKVGEASIDQTIPYKTSFEGLDIGRDTLYPVSPNYADRDEFTFTGSIERVVYDLQDMP
ncbi:arylsulfatase [Ammoniphilus sp. 3BR4]|uniref:arylsulfatase n=1 Tax=Ammoniphilus sp. 3BR4 TaxID=3158265 RepID=UPI003467E3CE